MSDILVLKFGSSVLPSEAGLAAVVEEIARHVRGWWRVVAVVSAMGDTTDRLLKRTLAFGERPDEGCIAALAATGEAQSAALLGLALNAAGIGAHVLDPGAIGLTTAGPTLDSRAAALDVASVHRALTDRPVLIVPGFIGRDGLGRATLLGRGGSDLTALFIARQLGASCRLVKDVDGLYDADPAEEPNARRFEDVQWDDVLALSEGIVQHKAVREARDHGQSFEVGALGREHGTRVGAGPSRLAGAKGRHRPEACATEGAHGLEAHATGGEVTREL